MMERRQRHPSCLAILTCLLVFLPQTGLGQPAGLGLRPHQERLTEENMSRFLKVNAIAEPRREPFLKAWQKKHQKEKNPVLSVMTGMTAMLMTVDKQASHEAGVNFLEYKTTDLRISRVEEMLQPLHELLLLQVMVEKLERTTPRQAAEKQLYQQALAEKIQRVKQLATLQKIKLGQQQTRQNRIAHNRSQPQTTATIAKSEAIDQKITEAKAAISRQDQVISTRAYLAQQSQETAKITRQLAKQKKRLVTLRQQSAKKLNHPTMIQTVKDLPMVLAHAAQITMMGFQRIKNPLVPLLPTLNQRRPSPSYFPFDTPSLQPITNQPALTANALQQFLQINFAAKTRRRQAADQYLMLTIADMIKKPVFSAQMMKKMADANPTDLLYGVAIRVEKQACQAQGIPFVQYLTIYQQLLQVQAFIILNDQLATLENRLTRIEAATDKKIQQLIAKKRAKTTHLQARIRGYRNQGVPLQKGILTLQRQLATPVMQQAAKDQPTVTNNPAALLTVQSSLSHHNVIYLPDLGG